MARYIKDFPISADAQIVQTSLDQYLKSEGYQYKNFEGENVYRKGNGIVSGPTFFKFSYYGNMVRMETWMKYAMLPGVYVDEIGVDGFVGSAAKGPWKRRIGYIEKMFVDFARQTSYTSPTPAQDVVNTCEDNETQLLNDNDSFEETCILQENKAEPVAQKAEFCTGCGAQLKEGVRFCAVCGKRCDAEIVQPQPVQQVYRSSSQNFIPNPTPQPVNNISTSPTGGYISRKEFIEKYAQPSLKKDVKSVAILCYVCAGLTFLLSLTLNPIGIIDALLLFGLALGMHLGKSRGCAISLLVLGIVEVFWGLIMGTVPYLWLVAGISAVVTFNKIEKQYKQFSENGNTN